jgi:ferrous iron transport protein B
MKIALVGNQNCGKTTLFNALTGSNQHVGNFPGVTVDSKVGLIRGEEKMELVDLPGIYSLSPYSSEELVTRQFVLDEHPDVIMNIVDATNIERNLYLTLQLCELNIPVVMALNMMDEVKNSGNSIDLEKLQESIGIPVCSISASLNEGIEDLIQTTKLVAQKHIEPKIHDFCVSTSPVHRSLHAMMHLIEDHALEKKLPLRFVSTEILEGDKEIENRLGLSENEKEISDHLIKQLEEESKLDREAAIISMRYDFIDSVSEKCVTRVNTHTKEQIRSSKIDRVLTNRHFAFPIFFFIMALVFVLTFGVVNTFISEKLLGTLIDLLKNALNTAFVNYGLNEVVRSLLVDGVITGVGSVLGFVPTIVALFFFLSLLEDSGYMARVAFMMDKPLRKLGLSGRSFVPMLIGFGCSVPAVMATRTLTSKRDRRFTLMLIPYMCCSAKLVVFLQLAKAFFPNQPVLSTLVIIGLYVLSLLLGIFITWILQFMVKGKPTPFMMELPAYRFPSMKNTGILMWEKAKDFLKKAFTIIFVASVVVWFLQSFDLKLNYVNGKAEDSILAILGTAISVIFKPLGFGHWEITSAILAGLTAKESVVSTLDILLEGGASGLLPLLGNNTFAGISLLIFILLYMPCIATFATLKKELNSFLQAFLYMAAQTAVAYVVCLIIYQVGMLFL